MTPEQARELLAQAEGTDAAVLQAHMDWKDVAEALETIANLRYEYAMQVEDVDGGWRTLNDGWLSEQEARARRDGIPGTRARIVRRLVSDVEVVE